MFWLCMLGNLECFFFSSADFFQNQLFGKILSGIPSACQTVWIQIKGDASSGPIWVHTVCKGYQQTTLVGKVLRVATWVCHYELWQNCSSFITPLHQCILMWIFSWLTLKVQSWLQQTTNFVTSFLIFEKNKVWYFIRIVCQQTILMKCHALFLIFENAAKFEIVVCCKM